MDSYMELKDQKQNQEQQTTPLGRCRKADGTQTVSPSRRPLLSCAVKPQPTQTSPQPPGGKKFGYAEYEKSIFFLPVSEVPIRRLIPLDFVLRGSTNNPSRAAPHRPARHCRFFRDEEPQPV